MAVTPQKLIQYKQQGRRITVLTAADYLFAQIMDQAGVDVVLVGDSLAMVTLGYDTTLPVTLEEMLHHAKAVRRGVKQALLIVDLPFLSYQVSLSQAIESAGRILKETGAGGVKLEGGYPAIIDTVAALVQTGMPVLGHIGLTPQAVRRLGYRQQGTTPEAGEQLLAEAIALEQAGAFAIVLEHIPDHVAATISQKLSIPTIGIGAGPDCDGQVLVTADLLGLSDWRPPFAKAYANLRETVQGAVEDFCRDIREGQFPPSSPKG
ncbi:MAG: 3-methyl-2-oxobutanoate hydroxymethyltransferase [Leptolyngbya sp. DLM2.Bin15]|nr:MAG: 3-methyl-2-oxobutanoate hydroxymethyltransferase [Leptolyngbya sp. DLM2.Bin15]